MKNLKIARIRKDLSIKELAELVGVSSVSMSLYESGKSKPKLETLIKLSKELDVTTDNLLGLEE